MMEKSLSVISVGILCVCVFISLSRRASKGHESLRPGFSQKSIGGRKIDFEIRAKDSTSASLGVTVLPRTKTMALPAQSGFTTDHVWAPLLHHRGGQHCVNQSIQSVRLILPFTLELVESLMVSYTHTLNPVCLYESVQLFDNMGMRAGCYFPPALE